MKNIRSHLLQAMPGGAEDAPVGKRIKRMTLVLFLLLLVGVPVIIIVTGILPRGGAGYPFYWVHDHIWLPLKGYTYTLFYPFSLSWWGPLATITLVWFLAYLARVPLTKDPHSHVLRRVVRRQSKHRVLLRTTQLMRKWRFGGVLLQEVTDLERRKAINSLRDMPLHQTDDDTLNRVFYLTKLHINLILMGKPKLDAYWQAAPIWYNAFLQSRGTKPYSGATPTEYGHEITVKLAEMAPRVLMPLLNIEDVGLIRKIADTPSDFDLESIILDLYYLTALHNDGVAIKLPGITTETLEHRSKLHRVVVSRLADSVNARQAQVDRSRKMLERFRFFEIGMDALMKDTPKDYLVLLRDNSKELPVLGRLALWIALDYAVLMESSTAALSFVESLESLDFEFNCLPLGAYPVSGQTIDLDQEGDDPVSGQTLSRLSHPLKELPQPADFLWCAQLAEKELEAYEEAWKEFASQEENPINKGDLELARTRIRSLYHAAGPNGN